MSEPRSMTEIEAKLAALSPRKLKMLGDTLPPMPGTPLWSVKRIRDSDIPDWAIVDRHGIIRAFACTEDEAKKIAVMLGGVVPQ